MDLLKFFTAGNVDDGKSTLIGRLLYDSGSVSTDIIETLTKQSKSKSAETEIDLALLTDGLRAEREQGITIDVAYKFFSTEKRKFIIADTPGHIEYTRNMFTGASNADLAIILIDARNGITEQTKRHTIISSVLGIPNIVVCINKMDLINYSEKTYSETENEFRIFSRDLNIQNLQFIPVSALTGENVVKKSDNFKWYEGKTLLDLLESTDLDTTTTKDNRFQVQYVIRPQSAGFEDYRGYAGSILGGSFRQGEKIKILPSGLESTIARIEKNNTDTPIAFEGDAVIVHLEDDIDISRGNTIVPVNNGINVSKEIIATICWMDQQAFLNGQKFILQSNSFRTKAAIKSVISKIDIHSFAESNSDLTVKLNDLFKATIKTADPLAFDSYKSNRKTGSFILINESTNNTVAAGVIEF